LATYNFSISYKKGLENARADALSKQEDYIGKTVEQLHAILKEGKNSFKYNYKLLATILVVENNKLVRRIKDVYAEDEYTLRILKEPTKEFDKDQQGLLQFNGLVYISTKIRQAFIQEQHSLPAHRHQGIARTFERMAQDYYFLRIRKVIKTVVTECNLYNKSKTNRHALYRLLQPPPTLPRAWKLVAFNFIVKLPKSKKLMTKVVYNSI
jgi:hypothetical protein